MLTPMKWVSGTYSEHASANPKATTVLIWDANLGLRRSTTVPIQSDGLTEEKTSHLATAKTKPDDTHEFLSATFEGSVQKFRLQGCIPADGEWILQLNIVRT
jgi:hypothetical protein